jgi:hypothetical protein
MQEEAKYWYLHDHQLFSVLSREENRALCLIPNFKTVKKILDENLLREIVEAEIHFDRFKDELSPKPHKEINN